LAKIKTNLPE